MYGGSIENRAKFACEIIECVKEKVGKDYPVICRMTGDDFVEGGTTPEDAKNVARLLVKSGADCLHISVGISETMVSMPPMSFSMGCFVHLAQGVKEVVKAPVIAVGKLNDPVFAEKVLVEQKADLIAMGRSLISDPFLPKKVEKGELEDIIPCISCNQGCISRVLNGLGMTCLVNPSVGKEFEFKIVPAKKSKKVLIAGGGPAGLEAAIICKKRGHDVVLAEKGKWLGGQLNYAWKPPQKEDIKKLIDYFCKQIKKLKIETYMGKNVDKIFFREINPEVFILAVGSIPIVPEIPGIRKENVILSSEILEGKKVLGKKVIIIGGGRVGLETADFLAEWGKKITILEKLSDVGLKMAARNKIFLLKKLSEENVNILLNREAKKITEKGVYVEHFGQQEEIEGDVVVIAMGSKPERELLKELEEILPELDKFYLAGDCVEPRDALHAIYEGARIARDV